MLLAQIRRQRRDGMFLKKINVTCSALRVQRGVGGRCSHKTFWACGSPCTAFDSLESPDPGPLVCGEDTGRRILLVGNNECNSFPTVAACVGKTTSRADRKRFCGQGCARRRTVFNCANSARLIQTCLSTSPRWARKTGPPWPCSKRPKPTPWPCISTGA